MPGLAATRRLVVKIGSALLVDTQGGQVRQAWLDALCDDLAQLRRRGIAITVVSSGAVALGRHRLGLTTPAPLRLEERQACAASGQIPLINAWAQALAHQHIGVAQILLTLADTEARHRHLNARATLTTLLEMGVLPVINENDTIAAPETRFGDNDRLAARVAQMTGADTLVLLSDIDGLYTSDPRLDPKARHVAHIDGITPDILAMAGGALPGYSSGGMVSKLEAARIATAAGCRLAIAPGTGNHPLAALEQGGRCSWFKASSEPLTARKRWIASAIKPNGVLTVDSGAVRALLRGKSLLPAGVLTVEGVFQRGDTVLLRDPSGLRLGCGLVAFTSSEAMTIAGRQSGDIETLLGYSGRSVIIHRDDLVLDPGREDSTHTGEQTCPP